MEPRRSGFICNFDAYLTEPLPPNPSLEWEQNAFLGVRLRQRNQLLLSWGHEAETVIEDIQGLQFPFEFHPLLHVIASPFLLKRYVSEELFKFYPEADLCESIASLIAGFVCLNLEACVSYGHGVVAELDVCIVEYMGLKEMTRIKAESLLEFVSSF